MISRLVPKTFCLLSLLLLVASAIVVVVVDGFTLSTPTARSTPQPYSTVNTRRFAVNGDSTADDGSRDERYQKAMEEGKSMKVGELRKELADRGISTKSFFEKTEFVKAYADAIADKKEKKSGGSSSGSSSSSSGSGFGGGRSTQRKEEPMDPSYRDVTMQKIDRRQLIGSTVIDTSAK